MKIGVAGAGAVGGYFGGVLAQAGNQVVFLARGAHLEAMKAQGLRIESAKGEFTADGIFTNDIHSFKGLDLILFCVKSTDTKSVAEQLKNILDDSTRILVMQNGIDNEEILSEMFGKERVLSTATYLSASVKEPGIIHQFGEPRLPIGTLNRTADPFAKEVVAVFNHSGVKSWASDDIICTKWQKLLWNVTFNPLSAIVKADVGQILDDPLLRRTAGSIQKEAFLVAKKKGIRIAPEILEQIFMGAEKRARNHKTSMLQDRLKGKRMEIESLCGYLVREGERLRVETPVLQAIYVILTFIEQQELNL
ncbi:ketopantoate reductase family protein [Pseudalkalibacillus sp. A8]|uniref:ketopantoate reductase family protein n=1 Tax=Pseudalkalibacillus sp. A8 TaxID=3382641 RepID=UPI0038B47FF1